MSGRTSQGALGHNPYAALLLPAFAFFSAGRNLSALGDNMQSLAIGWELYRRSHSSLTLGYVGLVQVLPIVLFALPAGHVADSFPRKRVAIAAQFAFCLCAVTLSLLSRHHAPIGAYYLILFLCAAARAFGNPARGALLPAIVPKPLLSSAISWDTSIRRIAVVSGAALGGWALALVHFPYIVYGINAGIGLGSALLLLLLPDEASPAKAREPVTWSTLMKGVRYIWSAEIVLATITLDLFAVLLGGATTMLPVYASDILHVGPDKLGWLRAAASIGAFAMALSLAHLPAFKRPGRVMLWAVAGFGVATIVFGLSKSLSVSLAALFVLGALDMISVVVRQTLIQILTPDEMRGRVNAVNSVFINSSNELGGFESGLVAHLTSPVFSVVSGGIGSLLVVMGAALRWPALTRYRAGADRD